MSRLFLLALISFLPQIYASLQAPYAATPPATPTSPTSTIQDDPWDLPLDQLEVFPLYISGNPENRVDLVFFGDGYLKEDALKFRSDAQALANDIILAPTPSTPTSSVYHPTQDDEFRAAQLAQGETPDASTRAEGEGAFGVVKPLINIWGVHVPSNESGIGDHDVPRNTTFGLYRPGPELRGVFYAHGDRVIRLCKHLQASGGVGLRGLTSFSSALGGRKDGLLEERQEEDGLLMRMGCDEPILLGNDPLYGGLGGTPTVITASKVNGPMVLRHELGHTLIPVGEEYEGGEVYEGVNANPVSALDNGTLTWNHWLTDRLTMHRHSGDGRPRLEDVKVPLQVYPWHDLSASSYSTAFNSSLGVYPTAMLRISISSIPHASHLSLTIDGEPIPFELYPESIGSKDRAWVEVQLPQGLSGLTGAEAGTSHILGAALTLEGRAEPEGQGGKMVTSMEIVEYGPADRCDLAEDYVGAFPTYAEDGSVTVRPTNEYCLMRNVRRTTFCPPCKEGLVLSLLKRVSLIEHAGINCRDGLATLNLTAIDFPQGYYQVKLSKLTSSARAHDGVIAQEMTVPGGMQERSLQAVTFDTSGWFAVSVTLHLPGIVRLEGREEMFDNVVTYFPGCPEA